MHNTMQVVKLVLLTAISLGLLGVITYFLFTTSDSTRETVDDGRYEVYERFANRYYNSLQSYTGVCFDMKPTPQAVCEDSDTAFRVYERLEDGQYNCTDVRGYQGRLESIPDDSLRCQ